MTPIISFKFNALLATSSDLFGPYLGIPTSSASGVVGYQYQCLTTGLIVDMHTKHKIRGDDKLYSRT